jgi:hypothetical protein
MPEKLTKIRRIMLKLNDEDYIAKIEYLQHRSPDNPLLPKLRSGNSALNSIYLMNALNDLPQEKPKVTKAEYQQAVKDISTAAANLQIQQRHLRASRAELSNQFASCATDAERRRISVAILDINKQLEVIYERIEAYQKYEELPELPVSDKYPVPDNLYELGKKNHTLRTSITRLEKSINEAIARNVDVTELADKEQKLRELKIHRSYVERSISRHKAIQS